MKNLDIDESPSIQNLNPMHSDSQQSVVDEFGIL